MGYTIDRTEYGMTKQFKKTFGREPNEQEQKAIRKIYELAKEADWEYDWLMAGGYSQN